MLIIYEVLLFIYVLVYFPVLIIKGKWHDGFAQRFGFFSHSLKEKVHHHRNIWIHAVSVGEVIAITELIRKLKRAQPDHQIILTTSTKTGHELALKRLSEYAVVLWAPLDFRLAVASFVRLIQPKVYVVAETELWPNLFTRLHRRGVGILLINGRISDNSYGRYLKIRWFIKRYLGYMSALCMQSQQDVERILAIGAPQDKVSNIGNVKFDDLPEGCSFSLKDFGFEQTDRLWIAGSTHPGEEEIVLRIFEKIRAKFPSLRLVIAPRHIERVADVQKLVEAHKFHCARFSQMNSEARHSDSVVIVDTIGHLRSFYALATLVFIGKSLTVKGGHNIIEPAFFSKPIIVGPYMQNFRDVLHTFKKGNALVQVQNAKELELAVSDLLDHPQKMVELGEKAKQIILSQQGATARGVELIVRALNKSI